VKPNCITAWYNKGFANNMMGNVDEAIECYDQALSIDPNNPSVLYNKRFALYRIGKSSEAKTTKLKLDSIDPGFEEALDNRGTKFFLPKEYDPNLGYELPLRWYNK
jgi:tetratricopeptide (TPR) repeat protein